MYLEQQMNSLLTEMQQIKEMLNKFSSPFNQKSIEENTLRCFSRSEAAEYCGVSIQTIDDRIKSEQLPTIVGTGRSRILIKLSDIQTLQVKGILPKGEGNIIN